MADQPTIPRPPGTAVSITPGAPTVRIEDVHVRYKVYADAGASLRDKVASRGRSRQAREVHALRGISFEVGAGEAVGIVGPNGSGKSTLMRVVAGLQPVSEGAAYARVTPMLLGVGAALNRSLSGRRNILLGGLALGLSGVEIAEREEQIIAFADIGDAIDRPMRTYSSGMSARLHFAISSAVEPDILIIDEALAVGDDDFQAKCRQRMRELRESAGTIFFVSHSMEAVRSNCTRVLWIEDGVLHRDGEVEEVLKEYTAPMRRRRRREQRRKRRRRAAHEAAEPGQGEGPASAEPAEPAEPAPQTPQTPQATSERPDDPPAKVSPSEAGPPERVQSPVEHADGTGTSPRAGG